jgi:oligosaccharyltransferase complex subunit epsilon
MAKSKKVKSSGVESKAIPNSVSASPTPTTAAGVSNNSTISFFEEIDKSITLAISQYKKDLANNQKLRLIDTFLAFLIAIGIVQFGFCLMGGSFPFNAFLSGFSATVGQFVLTVGLRLQSSESNKQLFNGLLPERAFGEYVFASLILHFVLIHFIN